MNLQMRLATLLGTQALHWARLSRYRPNSLAAGLSE